MSSKSLLRISRRRRRERGMVIFFEFPTGNALIHFVNCKTKLHKSLTRRNMYDENNLLLELALMVISFGSIIYTYMWMWEFGEEGRLD